MVYTANCNIYLAVHENGINRIIKRAMMYVPSFFNFGSSYISRHPQLACNIINADPSVTANGDPLISAINLPIPTNVQLPLNLQLPQFDFIAQLSKLQVDFYPGNVITLPQTLPHPLPTQNLAIHAQAFMGLSCPLREGSELDCFSLDVFTELALKNPPTAPFLNMNIGALDVVGINPDGLRNILDCYMVYFANQALSFISNQTNNLVSTPQIAPVDGIVSIQVSPAPVPHNPAVEDDQLKLFLNLVSLKLNEVIGPSGSSSPGSNLAPPTSKSKRTRPGTGPSDLTVAMSQGAISRLFSAILNGGITLDVPAPPPTGQSWPPSPPPQGWGQYGSPPLYIYYKVSASLHKGSIILHDDGTIEIKDLEIWWDTLKFKINIDLPGISIPGIHTPAVTIPGTSITIIPAVNIPGFSLFGGNGGNPDISIPIDLSGDLISQVSIVLDPTIYYGVGNPSTPNCPNRWQLYVIPQLPIFVLPVELSANLTNSITIAINSFFNNLFGSYASPVVTVIKDLLGAALALIGGPIASILNNLPGTVESIVDMIVKDNLGITKMLDNLLYDYFTNRAPIIELQDPFPASGKNPIGPAATNQNPIGPAMINIPIPIAYFGVSVNSHEMVLEGDIGP